MKNEDAYIVTVREITTHLVAGAQDADDAEKLYNDKKGVKVQSHRHVTVAPRTDDKPEVGKSDTAKE